MLKSYLFFFFKKNQSFYNYFNYATFFKSKINNKTFSNKQMKAIPKQKLPQPSKKKKTSLDYEGKEESKNTFNRPLLS